jgi:membrane protease YdiL (CAAX protease family)
MNTVVVRNGDAAVHGGLLLAALAVVAIGMPVWPWYLFLPLLIYGGIALALPPLRRTAPKLTLGRMGGAPRACAVILSVATTSVLVGFHVVARPEVIGLAAKLPTSVFGNLVLAGVCFSLVNAVLEELVFRGFLWEALAREWNAAVALGVTAVLFGFGHVEDIRLVRSGRSWQASTESRWAVCAGGLAAWAWSWRVTFAPMPRFLSSWSTQRHSVFDGHCGALGAHPECSPG